MKVLITGIAGTGKSTIVKALNERGTVAIDLHDVPGLMFWQDRITKEKVEYTPSHSRNWFNTVNRICDIEKLKKILNEHENVIMAGTAWDNQTEYFPFFDNIILLQCSPETLIHRMKTRINKSGYGKTKAEQEDNIGWQKEFDSLVLSQGAMPLSTEGNISDVVDKIQMIASEISIRTKNGNGAEQETKRMLEEILRTYELSKYIRCNEVVIEQGASGKAFPVIRLSAWKPGKEEGLLAQFIHEQFHWIEKGKEGEMTQAMEKLRQVFPDAPIDKPEGGGSDESTYCHLIVCRLELLGLEEILGKEKSLRIVSGNKNYTWIRKMAIERGNDIDPVIKSYFPESLDF